MACTSEIEEPDFDEIDEIDVWPESEVSISILKEIEKLHSFPYDGIF